MLRMMHLLASSILDVSIESRYTCVVLYDWCPIPSLIIPMGTFISRAMLAHECRAT